MEVNLFGEILMKQLPAEPVVYSDENNRLVDITGRSKNFTSNLRHVKKTWG